MDPPPTELYTLSLHDALPIYFRVNDGVRVGDLSRVEIKIKTLLGSHYLAVTPSGPDKQNPHAMRSEEHTSELQSHSDLVCRLLLEKKKKTADHRQDLTPRMIA